MVKNLPASAGDTGTCELDPWVSKIPWRRKWQPTPVFLPVKSHGQRSLVSCRPWGRSESGMTEHLHFHFSLSCIGEENGNLLQCSCLENPGDVRTFCCAKGFKFNEVPLVYFCFYFCYSRRWVIEHPALIYVIQCCAYVFL